MDYMNDPGSASGNNTTDYIKDYANGSGFVPSVDLSAVQEEIASLESYEEDIKSAGFEFEIDYALGAVSLLALPGGISEKESLDLFADILFTLSSGVRCVEQHIAVYGNGAGVGCFQEIQTAQ